MANTKIAPLERSKYRLVQCHDCDVVYLSPLPTTRDLDILYIDELQFDYYDDERARVIVDFIADRLRAMLGHMASSELHSVLEIGAGLAWMARAAKQISPEARTVAQDITKEAAARCPWVDHYIVASADDPRFDSLGPYDVI